MLLASWIEYIKELAKKTKWGHSTSIPVDAPALRYEFQKGKMHASDGRMIHAEVIRLQDRRHG
jgi:hypothetical protein